MLNGYYYFASIRKVVAAFGALFNEIYIQKTDGDKTKSIKVGLAFASKQAFISRIIRELNNQETALQNQIVLPRMAFEITGLPFDAQRMVNPQDYHYKRTTDRLKADVQLNPVPYVLTLRLSLYAQYIDDMLQIMEQILPIFNPSYNITINELPDMDIVRDIAVRLDSVSPNLGIDGVLGDAERVVGFDMDFSLPINIYPPVKNYPVIRKVIENIITNDNEKVDAQYITEISPATASYLDDWGTTVTVNEF